ATFVSHIRHASTDRIRIVIHKRKRIQAKFGRTSQNRINTAASVPGAVDQNLLYTIPLRMQLSKQQIHQIFLDEQKQGNQAQGDNQQPPREQKAGEKADGEGDEKCLGGDTYHLLGFANSQKAVSPGIRADTIQHQNDNHRQAEGHAQDRFGWVVNMLAEFQSVINEISQSYSQNYGREIGSDLKCRKIAAEMLRCVAVDSRRCQFKTNGGGLGWEFRLRLAESN